MSEFLIVLGLAALPAAGNFFGGVLAEISERTLSLALHEQCGVGDADPGMTAVCDAYVKTAGRPHADGVVRPAVTVCCPEAVSGQRSRWGPRTGAGTLPAAGVLHRQCRGRHVLRVSARHVRHGC